MKHGMGELGGAVLVMALVVGAMAGVAGFVEDGAVGALVIGGFFGLLAVLLLLAWMQDCDECGKPGGTFSHRDGCSGVSD